MMNGRNSAGRSFIRVAVVMIVFYVVMGFLYQQQYNQQMCGW